MAKRKLRRGRFRRSNGGDEDDEDEDGNDMSVITTFMERKERF